VVVSSQILRFIFLYILLTACSKGHFGNNCNDTCDECISELCNRFNGICDIQDQCKTGWHGVKCDKGTCIILYKYSWKIGDCILIN
jgi:hypothetical protein